MLNATEYDETEMMMDLKQQAAHRAYLRSRADYLESQLDVLAHSVGATAAYERWRLRVAARRARRTADRNPSTGTRTMHP